MNIPKELVKMHRLQSDIRNDITEVQTLLKTGVLQTGWPQEIFWAVATRFVICIRDLVAKSDKQAKKRIDFTDDVIVKGRVKDADTLITFMRDSLCHIDSDRHLLDDKHNLITMGLIRGKGVMAESGDIKVGSDYTDDIAFVFGNQRVYFQRHLLRAFREAVQNLQPILQHDLEPMLKQHLQNPS